MRDPLQDMFIQCGNCLVPAFGFGIGIPDTTVIVSADLLTHPITLGLWRWQAELPMLRRAEFGWD